MKTFDKVIIASKAALIITLFVAVVLGIGYANAQMFNPLNPYVNPYAAQDAQIRMMERQNAYDRSMRQADRQRQIYDFQNEGPPVAGLGSIAGSLYKQQMLQEQRRQSQSLFNMEMQNTKPNACGLDPTYRYARPGC